MKTLAYGDSRQLRRFCNSNPPSPSSVLFFDVGQIWFVRVDPRFALTFRPFVWSICGSPRSAACLRLPAHPTRTVDRPLTQERVRVSKWAPRRRQHNMQRHSDTRYAAGESIESGGNGARAMNRKRSEEQGREVQRIVGLAAVAVGSASQQIARDHIF